MGAQSAKSPLYYPTQRCGRTTWQKRHAAKGGSGATKNWRSDGGVGAVSATVSKKQKSREEHGTRWRKTCWGSHMQKSSGLLTRVTGRTGCYSSNGPNSVQKFWLKKTPGDWRSWTALQENRPIPVGGGMHEHHENRTR